VKQPIYFALDLSDFNLTIALVTFLHVLEKGEAENEEIHIFTSRAFTLQA